MICTNTHTHTHTHTHTGISPTAIAEDIVTPTSRGITPKSSHSTASASLHFDVGSELSSLDAAEGSSDFGSGKFGNLRLYSPPMSMDLDQDEVEIEITRASEVASGGGKGKVKPQEPEGFVGLSSRPGSVQIASHSDLRLDQGHGADKSSSSLSSPSSPSPAASSPAGTDGLDNAGSRLSKFGNLQLSDAADLLKEGNAEAGETSGTIGSVAADVGRGSLTSNDLAILSKFGNIHMATDLLSHPDSPPSSPQRQPRAEALLEGEDEATSERAAWSSKFPNLHAASDLCLSPPPLASRPEVSMSPPPPTSSPGGQVREETSAGLPSKRSTLSRVKLDSELTPPSRSEMMPSSSDHDSSTMQVVPAQLTKS